jgi:hypothetical protein
MPSYRTRRRTGHFCLGQPAPLSPFYLPTEGEVYNAVAFKRQELQAKTNNFYFTPNHEVFKLVALDVMSLWLEKGNLPVIGEKAVIDKLKQVCVKAKTLLKVPKERRLRLLEEIENEEDGIVAEGSSKTKKKKKNTDYLQSLFDICTCKCQSRDICSCTKERKVPAREWDFLADQRNDREKVIGDVDKKVTEAWQVLQDKGDAFQNQVQQEEDRCDEVRTVRSKQIKEFLEYEKDENDNCQANEDEEYCLDDPPMMQINESTQNRLDLSFFISEVDRFQISDRAAAALATGLLRDLGIVTDSDKTKVVDRYKIRRARKKRQVVKKRRRKEETSGEVRCLGFDGKKDKHTKVLREIVVDGKAVTKQATATEEHIVFVDEPGGKYLDHIEVDAGEGTGRHLGLAVSELVREYDSNDSIEAVCTDGTAVNTGYLTGAIAEVERNLGKPLQWLICLKHFNELPFRHIFDELDGGFGTSGPNSFKGELGKEVAGDIHLRDVVTFEPIESSLEDIPEDIFKGLSRDQQLLFKYAKAIIAGTVPVSLKDQKPGPLCHARWLTLALRDMILYTRTSSPSEPLIKTVKFIVQVYVVMWFKISKDWVFTMGARHLYDMMELIKKTQPEDVQAIAKRVMQHNAYFAHPENLLAAMLVDDSEEVRKKAVEKILAVRRMKVKKPRRKVARGIRLFQPPDLNWTSSDYTEMIHWNSKQSPTSEPPVTKGYSDDKLKLAVSKPLSLPKYPCHTTSVERCVKLVSEASTQVYGGEARHGLILSRVAAREQRKAYDTKKDYNIDKNFE